MVDAKFPETDLGNACAAFDDGEIEELRAIATLHEDAGGLLMQLANWAGRRAETLLETLPEGVQAKIAQASELALRQAYDLAFSTQADAEPTGLVNRALAWAQGERWHQVATGITGALGGLGGITTTLIDLPVTTTLILRSIQQVATGHGEDLSQPEVRAQCIAVFGLAGPMREDDRTEVGLFASRFALGGKAVAEILRAVLPRFGVTVSEKLLAQATPLLGAAAGATINPVFTGYYQKMAHVHFRLRKLERSHPPDQVGACFERIVHNRRTVEAEAVAATTAHRVGKG